MAQWAAQLLHNCIISESKLLQYVAHAWQLTTKEKKDKTTVGVENWSSGDLWVGVQWDSRWGGGGGGLLPQVFSWFSRVGPAARSPNESHVRPGEKVQSSNQMCTSSGVTFSSVCFLFCLSHSQYSLSSTSFCLLSVQQDRKPACLMQWRQWSVFHCFMPAFLYMLFIEPLLGQRTLPLKQWWVRMPPFMF